VGRDWHAERDESGAPVPNRTVRRQRAGRDLLTSGIGEASAGYARLRPEESLLGRHLGDFLGSWQFLNLAAQQMGEPVPQTRTRGLVVLDKSGRNVAEYLLDIFKRDRDAYDGIVDTVRWVLPYAAGLQADITSELERSVYLQMTEKDFKVPGWLLSTGTLRILALLAVLRHPEPPPLLVVEEIENGLDPRSVHMLLDEVRSAVQEGRTQVIATTHSPYVLDLLPLQVLCLVERNASGEPVFRRPADDKEVRAWARDFTPGKLYATGRFAGKTRP
jgi:predicted ATPase